MIPRAFLPDARLADLCRLAAKIPSPSNYLQGVETPMGPLPGNILCFARHSVEDLLKPAPRQRTQHHRCVLLVALHGSGRICLDSDSFMLQAGQAQVIFPFQFHSYMEVQPHAICWVFFTFESFALSEIASLRASPSRTLGSTEILLLRELIQCWLEKKQHGLLPLHLGLLLGRLNTLGSSRKNAMLTPMGADADLLLRVNSYILARLDQPLGLKELALAMGQSESHLRSRFRAATGYSLGRHIRALDQRLGT